MYRVTNETKPDAYIYWIYNCVNGYTKHALYTPIPYMIYTLYIYTYTKCEQNVIKPNSYFLEHVWDDVQENRRVSTKSTKEQNN